MAFPASFTVVTWVEDLGVSGFRDGGRGLPVTKSSLPKIGEMGSPYKGRFLIEEEGTHDRRDTTPSVLSGHSPRGLLTLALLYV